MIKSKNNKRSKCIVCGNPFFEKPLLVCKDMPSEAQNLPDEDDLDSDVPVTYRLCQCSGCGLMQFDCEPVSYYLDSTRAGERCDRLIKLRQEQYSHLIETYNLQGKKILEIGSGRGGFLRTLKEMTEYDVRGYGIEYNKEFVDYSVNVEGVNVVWGNPEDETTVLGDAPFDAFTSFAYPARLIDPNAMMRLAYKNLKEDGIGFIQVPSMEHLLKFGGFYDLTRDHMSYFDKNTLHFLCQRNGFNVIEQGEAADIYITATIRKRKPTDVSRIEYDAENISKKVKEFVNNKLDQGKTLAVWCAGHFAFTVLSVTGLGKYISYIIDNAKFKQNHFSPASHVPIYGPEHFKKAPVDIILILGPLYLEELVREIREKCSEEVEIFALLRDDVKEIK